MQSFLEALGKRIIKVDGAFGTMLQGMGLQGGVRPVDWNLQNPDKVKLVHAQYLEAGCEIVTANTFGASRIASGEQFEALLAAGIRIAREAINESGLEAWLAVNLGPSGKLLKPYGELDFEDAVASAHEIGKQAQALGADLCLVETMTDLAEIKATVLGLKEGCSLPVIVSMAFEPNGRLLSGATIEGAAAMLEGLGVDAIGLNCGHEPEKLMPVLSRLLAATRLPVLFSPNASLPHVTDGVTRFEVTPERFASDMALAAQMGATLLGGCCGTTPEHIACMSRALADTKPIVRQPQKGCCVSGRGDAVRLGGAPIIIGERINPTGKPLLKEALRQGDMDYVMREAVAQMDSGASVLDVNAGLPDIDEEATLREMVKAIQQVTDAPLQIDTASPDALKAALRAYIGKPIINSVSGKKAVMDAVFPLAKKYGGAIVALTLDENGIPATSDERVEIAKRIVATAKEYGIAKDDLIFDALTMAVSTDPTAAETTLCTMERLRRELGVATVLGVSNVSFGLPQRPLVTAAFLTMALGRGLSAAILNPLDTTVKRAFDAGKAVCGFDEGFADYIAAYGGQSPVSAVPQGDMDARTAILSGLAAQARKAAQRLMDEGAPMMQIVDEQILPALTEVGARFEKGQCFLPQLLGSAQAAQAAFDAVKERFPQKQGDSAGKVVLATVEGDVHDIGKNIVKVLLENYGFAVIDLGKDVKAEAVLQAAREADTKLVGLSALMTTTVPSMEQTIRLLRKELPSVKVMVGGAVLTQAYADQIGADFYGVDAMASVRYAQSVYSK